MVITLLSEVLSTEGGVLRALYKHEGKLDKFSLTIEDKMTEFALSAVWVNKQPVLYLKGFKAQKIEKNTLDRYEVVDRELYLFLNSQQEVSLRIVYQDHFEQKQRELALKVSLNLKVSGLKEMIQKEWKLNDFEIYDHTVKLKGSRQLNQCDIEENQSLTVLCDEYLKAVAIEERNQGGGGLESFRLPKIPFVNFANEIHLSFDNQAPKWRTVERGLNFEGRCVKESCEVNMQKTGETLVCAPKGFDVFSLSEDRQANCPVCVEPLKDINNCIFWDCLYSIEGEQENGVHFKRENVQAPKDRALSFAEASDSGQGNIVKWKYLKITTRPSPRSFTCVML
jgi:hypothetical protein